MSERQNLVSPQGGGGEFMTSLFGCFSDISVCIITLFLPCIKGHKIKQNPITGSATFVTFVVGIKTLNTTQGNKLDINMEWDSLKFRTVVSSCFVVHVQLANTQTN